MRWTEYTLSCSSMNWYFIRFFVRRYKVLFLGYLFPPPCWPVHAANDEFRPWRLPYHSERFRALAPPWIRSGSAPAISPTVQGLSPAHVQSAQHSCLPAARAPMLPV